MDHSSSASLAGIGVTFVLAGIVKGVTGMGLPTVSMGVLGAFMPPVAAASLLIVPSFVTNLWQLMRGPSFAVLASRLWPMIAGVLVGTIAGARLLTGAGTTWTTTGLGVALALYALFSLLAPPLSVPARLQHWLSPLIGVATGLVTGATGVFVVPAVPYLQALGLAKQDLVQALGLSFTASTVALAIGLAGGGALHFDNLAGSALAVLPSLAGMRLGAAIRERIDAATFRRWFLWCLVLLGVEMAVRPFTG